MPPASKLLTEPSSGLASRLPLVAKYLALRIPALDTPGALVQSQPMETPSHLMRDLAVRLLALEAADRSDAGVPSHECIRLFAKLRVALIGFAGRDGFASLFRRALALGQADVPTLHILKVEMDGTMDGLELLAANGGDRGLELAVAITSHLLGLLNTFIGEPLTLRIVRDAWPELNTAAVPPKNGGL